jgi:hypothetical protein
MGSGDTAAAADRGRRWWFLDLEWREWWRSGGVVERTERRSPFFFPQERDGDETRGRGGTSREVGRARPGKTRG